MSAANGDGVTPVLVFDGRRRGALVAARLWWHVVSRDRYEIRPADQLPHLAPAGPAVSWVAADGAVLVGADALVTAARAGRSRVRAVPWLVERAVRLGQAVGPVRGGAGCLGGRIRRR